MTDVCQPYRIKALPDRVFAGAEYPFSPALMKKLTLMSNFDERFILYKRIGIDRMLVPRNLVGPCDEDFRTKGYPIATHSTFVARNDEQERLVVESSALLAQDSSHIVCAPTGFGKTVIGAEIIARVGVTTLIIINKEDLESQWRESLISIIGLEKSDIGLIKGDICNVINKKVVIGYVQSLCKDDRYPNWVYSYFGLMMCDEVHKMAADKFSNTMWLIRAKLRIGLTATPYRSDGKDVVFQSHIGPVALETEMQTMIPKVIRQRSCYRLPRTTKNGRVVKIPHSPGKCTHVYKLMAANKPRNLQMVEFMIKAYHKGRNVVFFSDLKDAHLDPIHDLLVARGIPKEDIGYYVGGLSEKARDRAKAKRVVLTTYKMCDVGTNAPWWDTCVFGTPRADVNQIVGRIRREYEGKKTPVVFDLIDDDSKVFRGYAEKRERWYRSIKAKVLNY